MAKVKLNTMTKKGYLVSDINKADYDKVVKYNGAVALTNDKGDMEFAIAFGVYSSITKSGVVFNLVNADKKLVCEFPAEGENAEEMKEYVKATIAAVKGNVEAVETLVKEKVEAINTTLASVEVEDLDI